MRQNENQVVGMRQHSVQLVNRVDGGHSRHLARIPLDAQHSHAEVCADPRYRTSSNSEAYDCDRLSFQGLGLEWRPAPSRLLFEETTNITSVSQHVSQRIFGHSDAEWTADVSHEHTTWEVAGWEEVNSRTHHLHPAQFPSH